MFYKDEKIRSNQIEKNADKLKKNLHEIATKSMPETKVFRQNKMPEY